MFALAQQNVRVITNTTISRNFGRYKQERPQSVRSADVKENEALKQLKQAWKNFSTDVHGEYNPTYIKYPIQELEEGYSNALKAIKNINYSAEDVEKFSIMLAEFQEDQEEENFSGKAGLFLSALINSGKDENYVVHTKHLALPVDYLAYRNTKNVRVIGDVRHNFAELMSNGSGSVNGNALSSCGLHLIGGLVLINGDVRANLGDCMKGGRIIVNGNTSFRIGYHMEGGGIILRGNTYPESYVGHEMKGGWILIYSNVLRGTAGASMSGGFIKIHGNLEYAGAHMKGGKIYIVGNCENIGYQMQGGEIHIQGDGFTSLDSVFGGKIYHRGKLICSR